MMTHDSIGLGEDGPTHQPVEHLAALRAMPNLKVFRPADAVETAVMLGPGPEGQVIPLAPGPVAPEDPGRAHWARRRQPLRRGRL